MGAELILACRQRVVGGRRETAAWLDPVDVRRKFEDALDAVMRLNHRQLTIFSLDGRAWVFGGGESWGDPPEGYDIVGLLSNAPITYETWEKMNR